MGPAPHWVMILLVFMSTYRITRLITRDAFPLIAHPREWIQRKWDPFDDDGWENWWKYAGEEREMAIKAFARNGIPKPTLFKKSVAYLITCAWCTSVWVAAGLTTALAVWFDLPWPWAVLLGLASSAFTGLVSQREPS